MKWILVYFVGLFVFMQLLMGCTTPTKTLNFLTPDRIGLGKVRGTMNLYGKSSGWYEGEWGDGWGHGYENGMSSEDLVLTGESESDMIWLEWDFPQWKEPNDYDLYLRERVRTLSLEKELILAERELEKKNKAINKTIDRIDTALECVPEEREVKGMWPQKITEQFSFDGTGGA
jgi:hypothetical protein